LVALLKSGSLIGVPSCTLRYFPGPKKIRELIQQGTIGKPLSFTYQSGQFLPDWHPWEDYRDFYVSKRETGACREIVPYELTWLQEIFGKVNKISCFKDKLGDLDADIDDVYQILLCFENRMMGHLLVDVIARPAVRMLRINCSDGTIEWDHALNKVRCYQASKGEWSDIDLQKGSIESDYIHPEDPYIEELGNFIEAIKGKQEYPLSFENDEYILDLLRRAEESSCTGVHK